VTRHVAALVNAWRQAAAVRRRRLELYDTTRDWSQANDLSKQLPEKLHALQRQWLIEAAR